MTSEPDYRQYVAVAIKREGDVIGHERAIAIANQVGGLAVTSDGEVSELRKPGETVLEALIEQYKETSGEIAAFVIARRLENVVDDPAVLPENVRRHI